MEIIKKAKINYIVHINQNKKMVFNVYAKIITKVIKAL